MESGAQGDDAPEFLLLVLHDSSSQCVLLGAGRLVFVFLGDSGLRFLLLISGNIRGMKALMQM